MGNHFEVSVEVAAPPEAAWAVVGDPAGITWFPAVKSVEVREGTRFALMADDRRLVERIVDHDDAARRYSYSVVEGTAARLNSHLATISVHPTADGSRIVWRTEADPEDPAVDLEARLAGVMQKGLDRVKAMLEGDAGA